MDQYFIRLYQSLAKFTNTYNVISKIPKNYGSRLKTYEPDIHMLDALGRHHEVRIVELVEITGLTKGTISKTIKRLEKRQLIVKYHLIDNKKDIYYRLTDLGWKSFMVMKSIMRKETKRYTM